MPILINFGGKPATGNAVAGDLLSGKTATTATSEITGTMANIGAVSHSLSINGTYTIPKGYHDGTGSVSQTISTKVAQTYTPSTTDQTIASGQYLSGTQTIIGDADLVAGNIKSGVNVFGVQGSYAPYGFYQGIGATNTTLAGQISGKNVYFLSVLNGYGQNAAGSCTVYFYANDVIVYQQTVWYGQSGGIMQNTVGYTLANATQTTFRVVVSWSSMNWSNSLSTIMYTRV